MELNLLLPFHVKMKIYKLYNIWEEIVNNECIGYKKTDKYKHNGNM